MARRNRARGAALAGVAAVMWAATTLTGPAAGAQIAGARAYEMVSPPAKNGAEVIPQSNKTHVAPDAGGVTFATLGGFGTTQGSSFDFEWLSRRTGIPGTSGWSTQGINPRGATTTLPAATTGNIPTFVDAFTPDLSAAIYQSWRSLTDAPNVTGFTNLYRVDGLGGGRASAQLMSDAVAPPPAGWSTGAKLLMQPAIAGTSVDLQHVVFESRLKLTADAPQGFVCVLLGVGCPISLFENADGAVRLVGRIPNAPDTTCDDVNGPQCVSASSSEAGITATGRQYSERMVSEDGQRIFFQVPAGASSGAIYMREDGVRTVQLAQDGQLWTASSDGSRVFFVTSENLVGDDIDANPDLYLYDADAPGSSQVTLVSNSVGNDGPMDSVVGASADGRYVYFVCDGQLVPGEPDGALGLYVWHDGQIALIGRLSDFSELDLNGPRTGWSLPGSMTTARVAPDGRHLLFMTRSDVGFRGRGGFAGYAHDGFRELYLYNADTGTLVCASCNPTGRAATTDALLDVRDKAALSRQTSDNSHALSNDGRHVFFTTAEALVPADVNGTLDAYEYDTPTAAVHLISRGTDSSPSYFIDASTSGNDVFFVTRERLVRWDVDNAYDLYDARVGGGFPEPDPSAPSCSGEDCKGQSALSPALGLVTSSAVRGAGDAAGKLRRHRRCARGKVLRRVRGKVRCIKRKAHRRVKRAHSRDERSGR